MDDWEGHYWTVFELTRERPQSPPPSGIYPGGGKEVGSGGR